MLLFQIQDNQEVDSLVPLLFLRTGNVQTAVDQATDMVKASIRRLDAAERELLELYASDAALSEDIAKFVESCKYACTGNLIWR